MLEPRNFCPDNSERICDQSPVSDFLGHDKVSVQSDFNTKKNGRNFEFSQVIFFGLFHNVSVKLEVILRKMSYCMTSCDFFCAHRNMSKMTPQRSKIATVSKIKILRYTKVYRELMYTFVYLRILIFDMVAILDL